MPYRVKNYISIFRAKLRYNKFCRFVFIILSVLAILFIMWKIIFNIAFYSLTSANFSGGNTAVKTDISDENSTENGPASARHDVWNIFLVGADNDNVGGIDKLGNADGQMLVSIKKNRSEIILTSILRDTFFMLDSKAIGNKGTLLYHYYGIGTLIEAVEENLKVPIDNYIIVKYPTLIAVVDELGGIEMDLNKAEVVELNAKVIQLNTQLFGLDRWDGIIETDLDNFEGTRTFTLTGKQAAGLARVRLSDSSHNDFGRTERERNILLEIKDRFLKAGISKQLSAVKLVLSEVETDLSVPKMISALVCAIDFAHYKITSQRIPLDDSYNGSDGYLYIDFDKNSSFLLESIYGKSPID